MQDRIIKHITYPYAIEINNRFEILENMEDEDNSDNNINEKWESIKTIIKETKQ